MTSVRRRLLSRFNALTEMSGCHEFRRRVRRLVGSRLKRGPGYGGNESQKKIRSFQGIRKAQEFDLFERKEVEVRMVAAGWADESRRTADIRFRHGHGMVLMAVRHALGHFGGFKTTASAVRDLLQRAAAEPMVAAANSPMPDWSREMPECREDGINLQKEQGR